MAQFSGVIPQDASHFDSDEAADGQVLTADGAGGAAWEDPAGGSGGGLLWDTFDHTVSAKAGGGDDPYYRNVTFTLKSGSVAITEDTLLRLTFTDASLVPISWSQNGSLGAAGVYSVGERGEETYAIGLYPYLYSAAPCTLQVYGPEMAFYLVVFKPSGGVEMIEIDLS